MKDRIREMYVMLQLQNICVQNPKCLKYYYYSTYTLFRNINFHIPNKKI